MSFLRLGLSMLLVNLGSAFNAWLRNEARGGVSRHEQKKVNCQEPLRASRTKA